MSPLPLPLQAPSEVQWRCIPPSILGRDVLCQCAYGTGKTVALVLSILQQLEPNKVTDLLDPNGPSYNYINQESLYRPLYVAGLAAAGRGWSLFGGANSPSPLG